MRSKRDELMRGAEKGLRLGWYKVATPVDELHKIIAENQRMRELLCAVNESCLPSQDYAAKKAIEIFLAETK